MPRARRVPIDIGERNLRDGQSGSVPARHRSYDQTTNAIACILRACSSATASLVSSDRGLRTAQPIIATSKALTAMSNAATSFPPLDTETMPWRRPEGAEALQLKCFTGNAIRRTGPAAGALVLVSSSTLAALPPQPIVPHGR